MGNVNEEIDEDEKIIVKNIYNEIFSRFSEKYIIVFLCGGASNNRNLSLRDKVRNLLENEKKSAWYKPFKIFYPEDLLMDILNKTKGADLLSYEQFLAENSHIIAIVCESPGSLVELGAFTNNKYTVDKVIAAVEKNKARNKSFIMQGPIKYLKKKHKLNVIEYGQDETVFAKQLAKNIREKKRLSDNKSSMISLTTISGMHYFIQLILYFFKFLEYKEIKKMIEVIVKDKNLSIDEEKMNMLMSSALKLLFEDKKIVKIVEGEHAAYKLTHDGFVTIQSMINECTNECTIVGLCDTIRIELMYKKFYKSPHS